MERQLREQPPPALAGGSVLVQTRPADGEGVLETSGGEIVLALPSSEGLARQADDVERVVRGAGTGSEPLVIVIDAAEELRQEELVPVVTAAERTERPVILRVIRPSER